MGIKYCGSYKILWKNRETTIYDNAFSLILQILLHLKSNKDFHYMNDRVNAELVIT